MENKKTKNLAKKGLVALIERQREDAIDSRNPFNYNYYWDYMNEQYFIEPKAKDIPNPSEIIEKFSKNECHKNLNKESNTNFIPYETFRKELEKFNKETFKEFLKDEIELQQCESKTKKQKDETKTEVKEPEIVKWKEGFPNIDSEIEFLQEQYKILHEYNTSQCHPKNNKTEYADDIKKSIERINNSLKFTADNIYKLQMTQFAESIQTIKMRINNLKQEEYQITFDSSCQNETIPPVILNKKDYENLKRFRESPSREEFLDCFVNTKDKINPETIKQNNIKIDEEEETKNSTENSDKNSNNFKKRGRKAKNKKTTKLRKKFIQATLKASKPFSIYIPDKQRLTLCHQCKIPKSENEIYHCMNCLNKKRKHSNLSNSASNISPIDLNSNMSIPSESENSSSPKQEIEVLTFTINSTEYPDKICVFPFGRNIIIINKKIFFLENFDGNINEIVNLFFRPKAKYIHCNKAYCQKCLGFYYERVSEERRNFLCPACTGRCICSRCIRFENLVKQISYFLMQHGDLDSLYNMMKGKNSIIEKLKDYLVSSKFVCAYFRKKHWANSYVTKSCTETLKEYMEKTNDYLLEVEHKNMLHNIQDKLHSIMEECQEARINCCELIKWAELIKQSEKSEGKIIGTKRTRSKDNI